MRNFNHEQYDPYEEELLNNHAKEFSLYQIKEFREFSESAAHFINFTKNVILGSFLFGFALLMLIVILSLATD